MNPITLIDHTGKATPGTPVEFSGNIFNGNATALANVSGIASWDKFLVLASDELKKPTVVQVLAADGTGGYKDAGMIALPDGDKEIDLEAVASDKDGYFYVTGSHSWARKLENGKLGAPEAKPSRERYYRFKLKSDGTHTPVEGPKSLRNALVSHPVLGGFANIASKENGIDIEGLAVKDGRLYFGFRGPVLRDEWVPVLCCSWDKPVAWADPVNTVLYLRLGGRGIRDLVAVPDGFLVLAGPVGDGDLSYRIYFWDGQNHLTPAATESSRPQFLGEFANVSEGKPEGLAVLKAAGKTYDVLMVRDGPLKGGPLKWTITRP